VNDVVSFEYYHAVSSAGKPQLVLCS